MKLQPSRNVDGTQVDWLPLNRTWPTTPLLLNRSLPRCAAQELRLPRHDYARRALAWNPARFYRRGMGHVLARSPRSEHLK